MTELIATTESVERAVELLTAGMDTLHIGEGTFGLRLPVSFTQDEQREVVKHTREMGRQVLVAINGIIHPERMKLVPKYLTFLKEINVDKVTLGDPSIVSVTQRDGLEIPYIYDGETLVTSSRQINFWGRRGAIGAVLAREVPFEEIAAMEEDLAVPAEILVYGATCTHQSRRPLIQSYYNRTRNDKGVTKDEELFTSGPKKSETHYPIYEDSHSTHIFANNDVNSMNELTGLYDHHYHTWKLDGPYTPGENFVMIARLFTETETALEAGAWSEDQAAHATAEIEELHPTSHDLDNGSFDLSANTIK